MGATIQARLNDEYERKFEEIRKQLININKIQRVTPIHRFSDNEYVRDAEVIRYMIDHFKIPEEHQRHLHNRK